MAKSSKSRELSDEAMELIARRFKALSEASRLKLIHALKGGELSVTELVEATGLTQANASRHLQVLVDAGILKRRKDGLSVRYAIADRGIFNLCESVCGSVQRRFAEHAGAFGG
ncbi:MAG: ArsR/SmtB family transcription factor [Limisphaerales bacterium]